MFDELSHIDSGNNTLSPKPSKEDTNKTQKRGGRKRTASVNQKEDTIKLDAEDKFANASTDTQGCPEKEITSATKSNALVNNDNWIEVFAPTSSDDLAVHPKKLQEIQQWILHCAAMKRKRPAQICLITGPSGSGKTTALKLLAKENKISIQEWINPVDQEVIYNLGDQMYGQRYVSSQVDAFKNFLFKASRYRSLLESPVSDKRLLLVEDFPNFLLRDPLIIHEILE